MSGTRIRLVEREIEGIVCGALLAPQGWTVRAHHDIDDGFSLNVAQFRNFDDPEDSLFVAEYFVPRTEASDWRAFQQELQERLLACISRDAEHSQLPVCVVWGVERPDKTASNSSLAALLDQYVMLVSVVFYVKDKESVDAEGLVKMIVCDLNERYMRILNMAMTDASEWDAGVSAVYTPRGRCVIFVSRPLTNAVHLNPGLCKRGHWLQEVAVKELGFVSENLSLSVGATGFFVVVVLLPLTSGVSLMSRRAVERVWAQHVQRGGWHSEVLRRVTPSFVDVSSSCLVTPGSTFYILSRGNGNAKKRGEEKEEEEEVVVAWVTEPRAGSDSCVVLLTPASGSPDSVKSMIAGTHLYQAQCELLLSTFSFSVATAALWTPLGVEKRPGFLFREGRLVVHVPSALAAYTDTTVATVAAISTVSLGSIVVTAKDMDHALRRKVTFTLLKEFRSAENYVDYLIKEYMYDAPPGKKSAVFRKQKKQKTVTPVTMQDSGSGEEYSLWIRLSEEGAMYCVVRECGVGRLLLIHTCVLGTALDVAVAEQWETWVSGVRVAAVA